MDSSIPYPLKPSQKRQINDVIAYPELDFADKNHQNSRPVVNGGDEGTGLSSVISNDYLTAINISPSHMPKSIKKSEIIERNSRSPIEKSQLKVSEEIIMPK